MGHRHARSDADRDDRVAAIAPGRTLEIGCGTGINAIYLAQHGFEVVGVDISPLAIENARGMARGCCRASSASPS
jgi:methylase of polypeptide subunit release factors